MPSGITEINYAGTVETCLLHRNILRFLFKLGLIGNGTVEYTVFTQYDCAAK